MDDLAWATALSKAVTKHFLEDDDDHYPYVYFEQFDFAGGDIDSILFNMDIVPTREEALQDLADALGVKIVVPKDNDQTTYYNSILVWGASSRDAGSLFLILKDLIKAVVSVQQKRRFLH